MTTEKQKPVNQPEAKKPEVKQTQKPQAKKPEAKKQEAKQKVNKSDYDKYSELKAIELSGAKLKEETKEELKALENQIKACSGKIPNEKIFKKSTIALRAAIDNEIVFLIKGIPLPEEYLKIIKESKNPDYYIS